MVMKGGDVLRVATAVARLGERGNRPIRSDVTMSAITSTRHALEGFRRTAAADASTRRGQVRGLTADECATVLSPPASARAAPDAA